MNTMQVPESPVSRAEHGTDFESHPPASRSQERNYATANSFIISNFEQFPEVLLAVATISILNTLRKSHEPRRT